MTKKPTTKRQPVKGEPKPDRLHDKLALIDAMLALRRYRDEVLLKDLSVNGEVKMASQEIARHLELVLRVTNAAIDEL